MISYGPKDIQPYAPVAKQNLAKGKMSVADMCQAVVELSDNTCANLLLAHVGGPAALTAFWRSIGDTVSRLEHYEPELNRTPLPSSPSSIVKVNVREATLAFAAMTFVSTLGATDGGS